MIQEIWIIVNYNLYESKRYFAAKLAEAFQRYGVNAHILEARNENPIAWFNRHQKELGRPDFCCSFNRTPPNKKGQFYWDFLKIPHFSILVDPACYDVNLIQSPYSILSCVDRLDCEYLRKQNFQNIFFWPHAVERELSAPEQQHRPYDVVFFGSSCDPEGMRAAWQAKYPNEIGQLIDEAAEMTLANRPMPFWEATQEALSHAKLDPGIIDIKKVNYYVDNYTRGVDRLELIRSIKDASVHVYGATCWREELPIRGWMQCLGGLPNVTVHPAIPFQESLDILKQSKICLNSMPFFKDGTHERIFTGLACGCLPITNDNLWVAENFVDGEELILFRSKHWDAVNDKVNRFLADEELRKQVVAKGRAKVMREHTWDQRVEQLLTVLPPILDRIGKCCTKSSS